MASGSKGGMTLEAGADHLGRKTSGRDYLSDRTHREHRPSRSNWEDRPAYVLERHIFDHGEPNSTKDMDTRGLGVTDQAAGNQGEVPPRHGHGKPKPDGRMRDGSDGRLFTNTNPDGRMRDGSDGRLFTQTPFHTNIVHGQLHLHCQHACDKSD